MPAFESISFTFDPNNQKMETPAIVVGGGEVIRVNIDEHERTYSLYLEITSDGEVRQRDLDPDRNTQIDDTVTEGDSVRLFIISYHGAIEGSFESILSAEGGGSREDPEARASAQANTDGIAAQELVDADHTARIETLEDEITDVNRERWVVTERNTQGQGAGDNIFPFQAIRLEQTHESRLVTYNGNGTWTVTTDIYPVRVVLNAATIGATGVANRVSYIKDSSQPNGTRLPNSTDGVFGEAVPNVQATAVIPANTTITVEGRSVSSGNNQALDVGASMEFIELINAASNTIVTNTTGVFRLSRDNDNIGAAIPGTLNTGHDLTQAPEMTLRLFIRDAATERGWQISELDVDNALEISADSTNDGFALAFDNDFITFDIIDPVMGIIEFVESGRNLEYGWSELLITAPTNAGVEEIPNVALAGGVTTGAFQNLGDANELYTGADGDRVHVEYSDGNRDLFVFLEGIARSERKGVGANEIEIQVIADGQVQIRDLANPIGISLAWYEWKDGVVRTTKSIISTDCSVDIVDTGTNQDVSVDPVGIQNYLNVRRPLNLVFAKEGTSSHIATVNVFNAETNTLTPATFDFISNTTDGGPGVVNFSGGVNSNFNRRARTVDSIINLGDAFEFTVNTFSNQFASTFVGITDQDPFTPENTLGEYRIRFSNTNAAYTLFDPAGVEVASGARGLFRVQPTYYGIKLSVDSEEVYVSPSFDINTSSPIDTIPKFNGGSATPAIKIDSRTLRGRPYTVVSDSGTTTELLDRTFGGELTEIEVLRDETAPHGFSLRANTPSTGRQSQVRMSLVDGTFEVNNSGADTSLPVVLSTTVSEETIKHLIQWTDPVPHTELEFAAAATDAALVNTPAQTGETGVFGIMLFDRVS